MKIVNFVTFLTHYIYVKLSLNIAWWNQNNHYQTVSSFDVIFIPQKNDEHLYNTILRTLNLDIIWAVFGKGFLYVFFIKNHIFIKLGTSE